MNLLVAAHCLNLPLALEPQHSISQGGGAAALNPERLRCDQLPTAQLHIITTCTRRSRQLSHTELPEESDAISNGNLVEKLHTGVWVLLIFICGFLCKDSANCKC